MAFSDPGVMLGSDGLIDNGQGHPRAAGSFPKFFADFVRDGSISLYDGIAKMTSIPAKRLGTCGERPPECGSGCRCGDL